jgi:recombination protein RecT
VAIVLVAERRLLETRGLEEETMATGIAEQPATDAGLEKRRELTPEQRAFSTVRGLLAQSEQQLAAALPKGIPVSYMMRVVLTAVQRTPKLLECAPVTLLGAVFQAAQLGLVPDGVLGQAYLVPFNNRDKRRMEVQFIPGYRGLVTLARRSGEISTIDADVVHEKDTFKYVRGLNPVLEHIPSEDPNPGKIVKVYAFAKLKDGGFQIKVMTIREVEAIKARSAAVKAKRSSPWDTDPEWMFKKTALKQLCKLLPVSTELQRALGLDDRAEVNLPQDLALLADANETATPVSEDDVQEEGTVDSVDAELALVEESYRDAIVTAFDTLQFNKAARLVQLRAYKGNAAALLASLREAVSAEQAEARAVPSTDSSLSQGASARASSAPSSSSSPAVTSSTPPATGTSAKPATRKYDF